MRRKNVLSIMMQCFMLVGVISIQWVLFGYSLAFGPDHGGVIGGLSWAGLHGVGLTPNPDYAATIPHQLFMVFQMMFAVITPALIIGAFAERMKFSAFLVFSLLWATIVYDPMAHWVWGVGGWLRELGALDFAGGTVVHINAGMAALAAALVIGKRKGYPDTSPPHNLPFAVLGAALLWFGWFGFNAGSALTSSGLAVSAFLATHLGAAAAAVTWAADRLDHPQAADRTRHHLGRRGRTGGHHARLGLRQLRSARWGSARWPLSPATSRLWSSRASWATTTRSMLSASMVSAGWLAPWLTGLWATTVVNPAGANGIFHGGGMLLLHQFIAVLVSAAWSFVLSFGLLKLVDKFIGLRVSEQNENIGLDLTQHRESAYTVVG